MVIHKRYWIQFFLVVLDMRSIILIFEQMTSRRTCYEEEFAMMIVLSDKWYYYKHIFQVTTQNMKAKNAHPLLIYCRTDNTIRYIQLVFTENKFQTFAKSSNYSSAIRWMIRFTAAFADENAPWKLSW